MKKLIVGGIAVGSVVVASRRFGPTLMARAMKKCEGMLDRPPGDLRSNGMMRGSGRAAVGEAG